MLLSLLFFLTFASAIPRSTNQFSSMSRQTFAQIRVLSSDPSLTDPTRADRAMHDVLCENLKLTRRVLTKNLLSKLAALEVGTNEVEEFTKKVCKQNVVKTRNRKLVKKVMMSKVEDALVDEKRVRRTFVHRKIQYSRMIRRGSVIDMEFMRLVQYEVRKVWDNGKVKNNEKVRILINRYAPERLYGKICGVEFTDVDLKDDTVDDNATVIVYDGIELSSEAKEALSLKPEFMTYKKIDEHKIETEIEKGMTKARYAWMSEGQKRQDASDIDGEASDEILEEFEVYNASEKVLDYANLRATELPTVQHLLPPKPASIRREVIMQNIKNKMLNTVREYQENKCDDKGLIKKKNICKTETDGLKEIKEKINNKEMVVFTTDKSAKFK